ncbi:hypothetical protein WA538_001999 [Blastocystis sp. DL]
MSDSESSDLIDSEAGLEENEDEQLLSSNSEDQPTEESERDVETEENEEETSEDDEDEEEETSDEEEKKLTQDELKRLYLDDFSSDDEEAGNTIGNIPVKWYDKYDHIGYDLNGEKIMRPKSLDAIDKYIQSHDKNERWTIYDEKEGKEIHLSPRQIALIRNIQNHHYAEPGYNDETEYIPYFSGEVSELPWSAPNPVKSSFIPSKWERREVAKIVKRIREGRYKPHEKTERPLYEMWEEDGAERANAPAALQAPKLPLPTHSESYNPPEEYLLSDAEKRAWETADPADRETNYLPAKFACLRRVPLYPAGVRERYERCLDLYLAPRSLKRKLTLNRNALLPQLPSLSELRPFPTTQTAQLAQMAQRVRAVAVDASGYYVAIGDEGEVRVVELITGRVMKRFAVPGGVSLLRWNPSVALGDVLAVVSGNRVYFVDTEMSGNEETHRRCVELLRSVRREGEREEVRGVRWLVNGDEGDDEKVSDMNDADIQVRDMNDGDIQVSDMNDADIQVRDMNDGDIQVSDMNDGDIQVSDMNDGDIQVSDMNDGDIQVKDMLKDHVIQVTNIPVSDNQTTDTTTPADNTKPASPFLGPSNLLTLEHTSPVKDLAWHPKGDYVCVNASDSSSSLVTIHQLSKGRSQIPVAKLKGLVQRVLFSPAAQPLLFVATQTEVKVYNLVKQTLVNKLKTGVKWVSSMDVHPSGDNVVVGSYDCRLSWFDLDLSSTPFKTLRYHKKAIRRVQFHPTYPLMSTCSDDGTVHIFHTTVYNDFVHNALIIPLKVLRGHVVKDDLGVMDTQFHPTQPWIITAGADGSVRLFINIP